MNECVNILTIIAQTLFIFLGLSIVYAIIFKRTTKTTLIAAVLRKIRIYAYLSIISLSLIYPVAYLPFFKFQANIQNFLYQITIFLAGIIIIESICAITFDYFIFIKKRTEVPVLFKDLIKGILYVLLVLFFLGGVLRINIKPLLTTSAIFTVILGLALQETLGNVFSGIALHLSKPYSVGDWVRVNQDIGEVTKIDWRSTTIKTFSNDYIVIPNSTISKIEIENFSTPTKNHARYIEVGAHYKHPPNRVRKILLELVLNTEGILKDPPPKILVTAYGDFSINYKVIFFINEFQKYMQIQSEVMSKIWYHFKREEIEIPFPIRNIYTYQPETHQEKSEKLIERLKKIDFLKILNDKDLSNLAKNIKSKIYTKDEIIFQQGDTGNTFYIIRLGMVDITIKKDAEIILSRTLHEGDFFGEMSLLTGEPRSATVIAQEDTCILLALEKENLRDLLTQNPGLEEKISKVLAERKIRTERHLEKHMDFLEQKLTPEEEREAESLSGQILKGIQKFFSF